MSPRTRIAIGGLVLLIAALAVGAFFATHEKVEAEVRVPPSGEAKKNPYLALERLFESLGVETWTYRTLDTPYDEDGLVVFADPERSLSPEQVDAWMGWMESGGHAVVAQPLTDGDKPDLLLERLEFERLEAIDVAADAADDTATPTPEADAVYAIDDGYRTGVDWTTPGIDWRARAKAGDALVAISRPVGMGRLTVLGTTDLLRNDAIGQASHATFIWDVARLGEYVPGAASIIRYGTRQSWLAYVFSMIWPFLAALGVMVAFGLQHGRRRFGPLVPPPPAERRSRLEHVRATGRFLWNQGASASLVEAAIAALVDAVAKKRPPLRQADRDERIAIVAAELGISEAEARRLLTPFSTEKQARFAERIRALEEHRRKL